MIMPGRFAKGENGCRGVPVELHGKGGFTLSRSDFVPAYLKTYESGQLKQKVETALQLLHSCKACPRECAVNLMDQYHPAHQAEREPQYAEINRRISDSEFSQAVKHATAAGLWRLDARWLAFS